MREEKIREIIDKYIQKRVIPGATYLVGDKDHVEVKGFLGHYQIVPYEKGIKDSMYYDLASLTKILITTPLIMILVDRGDLSLSDTLYRFFPELPSEKRDITLLHLLTHTSGFYSYLLDLRGIRRNNVMKKVLVQPLEKTPGEGVTYSCINFVTLFYIVKKVVEDEPYNVAKRWIYKPLGMNHITYTPLKYGIKRDEIVPTKCDPERGLIHGVVHDPLAAHLEGISGNAGLFARIEDLYRYAKMILNYGEGILSEAIIGKMEKNYTKGLESDRGLGWQILGKLIGHTGYTGTSLYFSRKVGRVAILFTNRVHPKDIHKEEMQILRREFHEEVFGEI